MATTSFTLTVAKVNEMLFSGEAESITLPSADGVITILPKHEPLIALLKAGTLTILSKGEKYEFTVERGVCETSHGQVTVLL